MTGQTNPTLVAYAEIERAYAYFNEHLFDNRLPYCLITLQRQHDTQGYFSADQFVSRDGSMAHEIALNPSYFAIRPIPETLSVLVREMVTLDQLLHSEGKRPRRRYRNKEWADMAEAIGLMPTDTGEPGGRRVGDKVKTYIIEGGLFDIACSNLVDEAFTLSWLDRFPPDELSDPEVALQADTSLESMPALNGTPTATDGEGLLGGELGSPSESQGDNLDTANLVSLDHALLEAPDVSEDQLAGVPAGEGAPAKAAQDPKDAPDMPPMKRYEKVDVGALEQLGVQPKAASKASSKTKYSCSACSANAWGKPTLKISCGGSADNPHELTAMRPLG